MPDYIAPQLEKYFSKGGTYFENHVAAQPVCGPSRSSLLLGRYPHNTGYACSSFKPSYRMGQCSPRLRVVVIKRLSSGQQCGFTDFYDVVC